MSSFISFLFEKPLLRLLRALALSDKGRGVRELSDILEISVAGVHDILRRLKDRRLVAATRQGGRLLYTLSFDEKDRECLDLLIAYYEKESLQAKAKRASKESAARVEWVNDNLSSLSRL